MEDVIVVGGGIVGLATAWRLLQARPADSVVVLEKETEVGWHQSGHNSGVIHSGVYYQPGSLKARLCRAGLQATKDFCRDHGVPLATPGKLVVATSDDEVVRLRALRERATTNGLTTEWLDARELRRREPAITGRAAILVAETGVTDYRAVTRTLARLVADAGGRVLTGAAVTSVHETRDAVTVVAGGQVHRARRLVVCGGLQADRLLRLAGVEPDFRVVPFRGEYHRLAPQRAGQVRHLVYPVPDPRLPFLGVHVTPGVDGSVTVGPNAVPGLAREGYRKGQVVWRDAVDALGYPGTWRLARRHWRSGLAEARNSLSRAGYLAAVRRYWPDLTVEDLLPHEAGIRAQAVRRDGTLVDDFLLRRTGRSLHVCNAPSPAATSALPIADLVVQRLLAD
ncbi:L-2-hydroxyglutarate oxidase [Quadrisphaera sp. GCM10027208]|uniref:L-2-hydroxyglutarate oxidase n=1 Tax=Quadrisphaera sp. GCM10027208 TaxID=3273423 RepID=UPI0036178E23